MNLRDRGSQTPPNKTRVIEISGGGVFGGPTGCLWCSMPLLGAGGGDRSEGGCTNANNWAGTSSIHTMYWHWVSTYISGPIKNST